MTANNPDSDSSPQAQSPIPPELLPQEEKTITLLDVLLVITRHRWAIIKVTAIATGIALLFAIFVAAEYRAWAKVVREQHSGERSSLAGGFAALRGLGVNIGGTAEGITVDTYPIILQSREIRLAVARTKYYFSDLKRTMTLVEYHHQPLSFGRRVLEGLKAVTIKLPRTIKRLLSGGDQDAFSGPNLPENFSIASKEEEESLEILSEQLSVNVEAGSGIMTVSIKTENPLLSALLAQQFIDRLTERIKAISSHQNETRLQFIRDRLAEASVELELAEGNLSRFVDRNRDPQTARLRTEMEQLQRTVDFKARVFGDLQVQYTQAEIDLDATRPVITLIEAPIPPIDPSGPNRKFIVVAGILLGLILGVGLAYMRDIGQSIRKGEGNEEIWSQIRAELPPGSRLRRRLSRL